MKYSDFYSAYENKLRGSVTDVTEKLEFYDGLLDEIMDRFSDCNLLDIGCGRGEWLTKCSDLGINAHGIDHNHNMFNLPQEKGINIKYGEVLDILKTFESNSFQIISSFHLISHISFDTFLEIVEECKRLLVPSGVLILEMPSIDNILVSSRDFYLDPNQVTHFHPETIIFALNYFKFTDTKYFLLKNQLYNQYGMDSINNVLNGAAINVSIISTYTTSQEDFSLLDNNLNWINNLDTAKNTFQICNIYDKSIENKILKLSQQSDQMLKLSKQIGLLSSQVNILFTAYDKIFTSFPLKLYRKFKSLLHYILSFSFKIIKLFVSKILKIYFMQKVYLRISKFFMKKKFNSYINTEHDKYLTNFFRSDSRSTVIISDIKSKLNIK